MSQVNLYVEIREGNDRELPYEIVYHDGQDTGPRKDGGKIVVPKGGATIQFFKYDSSPVPFEFDNLAIHPMGDRANPLEMRWYVGKKYIVIRDIGPAGQEFNYCLGIMLTSGAGAGHKVYFDPQMINSGTGG